MQTYSKRIFFILPRSINDFYFHKEIDIRKFTKAPKPITILWYIVKKIHHFYVFNSNDTFSLRVN